LSHSERTPGTEFLDRLVTADVVAAGELARSHCGRYGLLAFYDDMVGAAFDALDERVRTGSLTLAQMYVVAAAAQAAAATAYETVPWPERAGATAVIACAPRERHSFGARIVADAFALAGWRDVFLGAGHDAEAIARAVSEHGAGALALSVTLPEHVSGVRQTIARARIVRPGLRVVVGGRGARAVDARQIGADVVAGTAREANDVASAFRIEL
jgi:methanogenic corrinoid protein MtbC1